MSRPTDHAAEEDLVLLAMGELPPDRSAALESHLETCVGCRRAHEEVRAVLAKFADGRREELDARLPPAGPARAELRRRLAEQAEGAAPQRLPSLLTSPNLRVALALAALALVAGVAVVQWSETPAGAVAARYAPDPRLTPGLATSASARELCASPVPDEALPVARPVAVGVFRAYGVADPEPRAYELDYLIPPELGGAGDARNLWPQPYGAEPWSAHAKDALEDRLRHLVCQGELPLAVAQRDLARDWTAAYRRYFRVEEPLVEHAGFLKDQPWE
ncbi:MAG: hypothetical protein GC160_16010 [Acidobacteria bacterium]|nr:hypothetical protein [Acidobacteriota bacterium]